MSSLRQGGAVHIASGQGGASRVVTVLYSSGVNRSVPDQGAVCRDQGGAGVRFSYLVLETVVVSVVIPCGGCMFVRRPERAGWYDWVSLRSNIEEGADSEEELWVTESESDSETDESDIGDGQED